MSEVKFKGFAQDGERELIVDRLFTDPRLLIKAGDDDKLGIRIAPSDAPALALAILEAAGMTETNSPYMQETADNLRAYVHIEEKVAAEAEAQAELEAEALKFYLAFHSAVDRPCQDWDYLDQKDKRQWLAVARRARELNKENQ